ncbi:hypothetical protein [Anatilimnocola floriformis]|uniref:hypothetical protein n=1 Tax=Anatilimnocola floriformis TaxID=2948575 RepID=UPI0020C403DA|nr:hypothetical protein [Anatilimnocola floriformis]
MKNQPDKPNYAEEQQALLRQQLWELSYGLLDADEEAALRTRIKSDPAIARLYSEVRLQAELVGRAARVEDTSLQISAGPEAKVGKGATRSSPAKSDKSWKQKERRGASGNWLAIAGTVALLLLVAFGLYQPQGLTTSVAQVDYYFTTITAPANTPEGVSQTVGIETTGIDNNGRAAEVAVRLVDEAGREIFRQQVKTNSNGRGEAQLPGELVRSGLRVEAVPAGERGVVSTKLQVASEQSRTLMLLEKPTAKPGDQVGFSMVDLKQFSKQTTTPPTSELMVENRRGGDVVEPMWQTDPQTGVITGQFSLPRDPEVEVEQLKMRRRAMAKEAPAKQQDARKQDQVERQLPAADEARPTGEQVQRQALMLDRSTEPRSSNGSMAGGGAGGGGIVNQLQRGGSPGGGDSSAKREAGDGRAFGGAAKKGSPAVGADAIQVAPAPPAPLAPSPVPPAPVVRAPQGIAAAPTAPTPVDPSPAAVDPVPAPIQPAPGAVIEPSDAPLGAQLNRSQLPKQLPDQQRQEVHDKLLEEKHPARQPGAAPGVSSPPSAAERKDLRMKAQGGPADLKTAENKAGEGDAGYRLARAVPENAPAAPDVKAGAQSPSAKGAALKDVAKLSVPEELLGKDLVVLARRDGRLLSRREFSPFREADLLDLPPEVDGLVDIELYRADELQKPAYSQQIVRAAARSLRFDVEGIKDQYKPGETVTLQVRVRDEQGRPVPAAVGVRVWNDVAAKSTSSPLLLVDSFARSEQAEAGQARHLSSRIEELAAAPLRKAEQESAKSRAANAAAVNAKPGEMPAPAINAAAGPGNVAPQAAAAPTSEKENLESSAGQQPIATFDSAEVSAANQTVMADNRVLVEQEYQTAVAASRSQQIERVQAIGRILVWGGAGLMLLVGLLLITRLPIKPIAWVPAVGLATITLALGLAWFVPAQPAGWDLARVTTTGALPALKTANEPVVENAPAAPPVVTPIDPALEAPAPQETQLNRLPASPAAPTAEGENLKRVYGAEASGSDGSGSSRQPAVMPAKPGGFAAADKPSAALAASAPQEKMSKLAGEQDSLPAGDNGVPPDSLYWRPLSSVGEDGLLTITFRMPAIPADYRLLLDAIGHGRIGGDQQLLICRE